MFKKQVVYQKSKEQVEVGRGKDAKKVDAIDFDKIELPLEVPVHLDGFEVGVANMVKAGDKITADITINDPDPVEEGEEPNEPVDVSGMFPKCVFQNVTGVITGDDTYPMILKADRIELVAEAPKNFVKAL